jgi:Zn-dependent metalloprotease
MGANANQRLSQDVAERIEGIVAAAEAATAEFREKATADLAQYAVDARAQTDAEMQQMQVNAEGEVARYLADAKSRIDRHAADRLTAMSQLTDRLIEHADRLQERFEAVETVRRQLYGLIASIGEVAERLAEEAAEPDPELPSLTVPRIRREP